MSAVVGGAAGFVGGLLIKKTQDMALMCGVLGGAAVAGACYAGWIDPKQLEAVSEDAIGKAQSWYDKAFGASAPPPAERLSKSKIMLSNVYKKAPGLVLGGAVGALVGYRLG